MKLLVENRAAFESEIDRAFDATKSIVCRYSNTIRFDDRSDHDRLIKEYLLRSSIREGIRVVAPLVYKGVSIHIMDETTCMATGSLKSIDGCLSAALCRVENVKRAVFESGGNTGSALAFYGHRAGVETFFFCPLENMDLLDSHVFTGNKNHLIGVADRRDVKGMARLFAKTMGARHLPEKSWRITSAMFRGLFILECLFAIRRFDWISQTISAGFGPIGIYSVLQQFKSQIGELPRFLGIQQEANCPVYRAWKSSDSAVTDAAASNQSLLSRVMYDGSPETYNTFGDLLGLIHSVHGEVQTVNTNEFNTALHSKKIGEGLLKELLSREIAISTRAGNVLEKTGLISIVGTIKAIDLGTIRSGEHVLCPLTSGVTKADCNTKPERIVWAAQDVLDYAKVISEGDL